MGRIVGRRPSPALVVASVALFVALSGGAYAAVATLPPDSVGTAQLKDNAVISSKVADHSLLGKDLKPGQLSATSTFTKSSGSTAGVPGPTLSAPGTYFVEIETRITAGSSDHGNCSVGTDTQIGNPITEFTTAWNLESSATANYALSGVIVVPSGSTPAYTLLGCIDSSNNRINLSHGAKWWYWKAG